MNTRTLLKKIKHLANTSFLEQALTQKGKIPPTTFGKQKYAALTTSTFLGLFCWLGIGLVTKNILLAAGVALGISSIIFIILLQLPLAKRTAHAKTVEADLPLFILRLATELQLGKGFIKALTDTTHEQSPAGKEFLLVLTEMKKGAGFEEALMHLNTRLDSLTIRRTTSHLALLITHGGTNVTGLKKLAQELLLKQRIESKEFSGKMVVYALVFIALSAIVPAMFQSFILIGSYFMKITLSAEMVFIICVGLFPLLDIAILLIIDKKTPLFLKHG